MNDIRRQVTERIIEAIEKGVPPWRKGWTTTGGLGWAAVTVRNAHRRHRLHPSRHHSSTSPNSPQSVMEGEAAGKDTKAAGVSTHCRLSSPQSIALGCKGDYDVR
jgi:hypothetical protein